jgi:hypothetical protein
LRSAGVQSPLGLYGFALALLWLYSYWRKVPLLLLLLEESAVAGEDGGRPTLLIGYGNGNGNCNLESENRFRLLRTNYMYVLLIIFSYECEL